MNISRGIRVTENYLSPRVYTVYIVYAMIAVSAYIVNMGGIRICQSGHTYMHACMHTYVTQVAQIGS